MTPTLAPTVRDMVKAIQVEVRDTDLAPTRACSLLEELTALLGNILDEIRDADMAYATVLLTCLASEDKANRAKIRAECSPEYRRKCEARDLRTLADEMIAALKYRIRLVTEEMRLSR